MDLIELRQRIAQGEDLHTEFKQWPISSDDLAASLVAFANTDGGQLILGVDREGKVVGVPDPDRAMQKVDSIAYQNCEPPLTVVQETVSDEEGNIVVVVNVPKGDQRPYRTNRGRYYIRTTSGRRDASRGELLRLFQATESLYYDETVIFAAIQDDIDRSLIEKFLRNRAQTLEALGISYEQLLVNLKLARRIDRTLHPTLAGILFFGHAPQNFIPYAYISALRIPGTDISEAPQDQKRVEGPMLSMLEEALRFLRIHLSQPHRIRELEPEARPELPSEALREVLVNALAHRDYTVQGPIRAIVYDDRVEVRTPGGLPNAVSLEALPLGIHILRNPTIYNLFLQAGLVTDAGSGIPRTIALVRRATGRAPELRLEGNEFVVVLWRPER